MNEKVDRDIPRAPAMQPWPPLAPSALYTPPERCQAKKPAEWTGWAISDPGAYRPPEPVTGLPTDADARNEVPIWSYQMNYFPDALLAEVQVAWVGNQQHNPGEPMHWAREKSTDHMNKAARHQFDYGKGHKKDTDGTWHLAKAIWRLKAQLQLDIEAEQAKDGT